MKEDFLNEFGCNPKLEKAIKLLEEGFEDAIQYLNEDERYQKYIRTTNSLEC